MSCGYFPGRLVGPVNAFAHAFTFPAISAPQWARSGAISNVIRARSTPRSCRPSGNIAPHCAGNPPTRASYNELKDVGLALVGPLVDEETGRPFGLTRPEIALPSAHPDEAETIEIDVAVLATLDVPEEDRFAEAVVWGLSKRAGARDGAAAVVEPVSLDTPSWDCVHENPRSCMSDPYTSCSWAERRR